MLHLAVYVLPGDFIAITLCDEDMSYLALDQFSFPYSTYLNNLRQDNLGCLGKLDTLLFVSILLLVPTID
jgi:hypothetical protein